MYICVAQLAQLPPFRSSVLESDTQGNLAPSPLCGACLRYFREKSSAFSSFVDPCRTVRTRLTVGAFRKPIVPYILTVSLVCLISGNSIRAHTHLLYRLAASLLPRSFLSHVTTFNFAAPIADCPAPTARLPERAPDGSAIESAKVGFCLDCSRLRVC